MKTLLLAILVLVSVAARAQQQPFRDHRAQQTYERLRVLNLSFDQKQRIVALIRRERFQQMINRKQLEEILTPAQKQQLKKWKTRPLTNTKDSTLNQ
jgi:hypothetical protein